MTSDIIQCGYCTDSFTREDTHVWCHDYKCYVCPDCTHAFTKLMPVLCRRANVLHPQASSAMRRIAKLNPTRFKP